MDIPDENRRRVFHYGDHRFDDPGAQYTTEQVRQHLVQYFPELAHATTEEKSLPDGTVEVSFCKQVARKGNGQGPHGRQAPSASSGQALLLSALEAVPPYEDPLAELTLSLGQEPLPLEAALDVRDLLDTHADRVFGLAGRTVQRVTRCLKLPPSPANKVPPGY